MDLTKQILNLKNIYKDFFNQELVYVEIKLTNKYIHCYMPDIGNGKGDEYTIDIEQYLKGYECKIAEIGYLTYPSDIECDFTVGIYRLWESYCSYNIEGFSNFKIPVFLYVQNNKFGLAYQDGTILNIFGGTIKEVIDKLNDMWDNNPNFKFHINEEFYNSL